MNWRYLKLLSPRYRKTHKALKDMLENIPEAIGTVEAKTLHIDKEVFDKAVVKVQARSESPELPVKEWDVEMVLDKLDKILEWKR